MRTVTLNGIRGNIDYKIHSEGEPLYSVSEHFINLTSVSANHYYFNQFRLLLAL